MKYPHYTKKQDSRCKLLEKDIEKIRALYKQGLLRITIAKKFKVSQQIIHYWTDDEYRLVKRKEYKDTNSSKEWRNKNKKLLKDRHKKDYRKKKKLQPKELKIYKKEKGKKYISISRERYAALLKIEKKYLTKFDKNKIIFE